MSHAPAPFVDDLPIPDIAQGYEEVYRWFLGGRLIYLPPPGSAEEKVELPIAALANPLDGTFDLSRWSGIAPHVNISTGYKKYIKSANAKTLEIWLAPRFLIERNLEGSAAHFRDIMGDWKPDDAAGVFWTSEEWDRLDRYDYVTMNLFEEIPGNNLYETLRMHSKPHNLRSISGYDLPGRTLHYLSQRFFVTFVN